MAQPKFRTRTEWWAWYGNYLKGDHWLKVVRPAVWQYRQGRCCECGHVVIGGFQVHHGKGMYRHLGEEQRYLSRMFVAHPECHEKITRRERGQSETKYRSRKVRDAVWKELGLIAKEVRKSILGR